MEIGRLIANTILNFHFDYRHPSLIYGNSRDGSKDFNIRTCEHMILGQLSMGARQTKNGTLVPLRIYESTFELFRRAWECHFQMLK